jgi:hypothetical protein
MKQLLFFVGICLSLFFIQCSTIQVGVTGNKQEIKSLRKVAILPFEIDSPETGQEFMDSLALYLLKIGKIEVLERDKKYIDKILQEQNFSRSGLIDQQTAAEMGKFLGVDAIVLGRAETMEVIQKTGDSKSSSPTTPAKVKKIDTFSIKVLNVESGLIIANARKGKGIEWSVSLFLKRVFGFGYFWTKDDLINESADLNFLSEKTVSKIKKELDSIAASDK